MTLQVPTGAAASYKGTVTFTEASTGASKTIRLAATVLPRPAAYLGGPGSASRSRK
jgi:hypothetical protein